MKQVVGMFLNKTNPMRAVTNMALKGAQEKVSLKKNNVKKGCQIKE